MGQQEDARKSISKTCAFFTLIQFLITDIVLYGLIIPVFGAFLGGYLASKCGLTSKYELVLIMVLTFSLNYGTFLLLGETGYWRHLFAFDKFYCYLLQIRDVINVSLIILTLLGLGSTVEAMVTVDKGMKKEYISEGVVYVFLKWLCRLLHVDQSVLYSIGFKEPHKYLPSFGEDEKFENGAAYMLLWAILTSCLAKMIYFNTLFTYVRAMEIFLAMNPIFSEDDEFTTSSTDMINIQKVHKSQLESNFARSMKKIV